jgi:hypothetical protein
VVSEGGVTVTVAESLALPPAPEHEREYVVVWIGDTETDSATAPPVEKLTPVQLVASVEDQESVEDWPELIEVGLAERDAVGVGTVAPPTVPLMRTQLFQPVIL